MKTSQKFHLPPGRVITNDILRRYGGPRLSVNSLLAQHLKSAELLRRKAYLRLARTVGISWLDCRRAALKH